MNIFVNVLSLKIDSKISFSILFYESDSFPDYLIMLICRFCFLKLWPFRNCCPPFIF